MLPIKLRTSSYFICGFAYIYICVYGFTEQSVLLSDKLVHKVGTATSQIPCYVLTYKIVSLLPYMLIMERHLISLYLACFMVC